MSSRPDELARRILSKIDVPEEPRRSSWEPVDLEPVITGEVVDLPPSILERTDAQALLYPGRVHMLAGEPESGKGWLALRACVGRMALGQEVLYFDFEDTAAAIVSRLRALAMPDSHTFGLFHYVRPEEPVGDVDVREIAPAATLAVIDGVTEAMTLHGLDIRDNRDVAEFFKVLARPLAEAGAAVLMLDHVTKDRDGRGRWALGAQHKLAGTDVTYTLEVVQPFGRGLNGLSRLSVSKDRPGFIRSIAANRRSVGDVHFLSGEDGRVSVEIAPATESSDGGFRPTFLMERVSRFLEEQIEPVSTNALHASVVGKAEYVRRATANLVTEGYVVASDGPRKSTLYTSARPYREGES